VTPHAWGTAIGQAAALHFYAARPRHPSTLTKEDKLIECDLTESPFRNAIATNPLRLENGCWHLPQVPGLGIEVDPAAIERFRWE
jgi:D-galactarolactone cycloisomerase